MNKLIISAVILATLALTSTNALRCYECAPGQSCATNYMNSVQDCSQSLLAQGGSLLGGTVVCAKFGYGKFSPRPRPHLAHPNFHVIYEASESDRCHLGAIAPLFNSKECYFVCAVVGWLNFYQKNVMELTTGWLKNGKTECSQFDLKVFFALLAFWQKKLMSFVYMR